MKRKMRIGGKLPMIGNRTSALTSYWVVVHGTRRSSAATGSIPSSLSQCRSSGRAGSGRGPGATEKPAIGLPENRKWTAGSPAKPGVVALI